MLYLTETESSSNSCDLVNGKELIEEVETDVAKENDDVSLKESDSALPLSSSDSLSDD